MSSSVQLLETTGFALRDALVRRDWAAIGELDVQCRQAVEEAMVEAVRIPRGSKAVDGAH